MRAADVWGGINRHSHRILKNFWCSSPQWLKDGQALQQRSSSKSWGSSSALMLMVQNVPMCTSPADLETEGLWNDFSCWQTLAPASFQHINTVFPGARPVFYGCCQSSWCVVILATICFYPWFDDQFQLMDKTQSSRGSFCLCTFSCGSSSSPFLSHVFSFRLTPLWLLGQPWAAVLRGSLPWSPPALWGLKLLEITRLIRYWRLPSLRHVDQLV